MILLQVEARFPLVNGLGVSECFFWEGRGVKHVVITRWLPIKIVESYIFAIKWRVGLIFFLRRLFNLLLSGLDCGVFF